MKPIQYDEKGACTRNASRRKVGTDKDTSMKSVNDESMSEEDDVEIPPVEVEDALVIEDDEVSKDHEDDQDEVPVPALKEQIATVTGVLSDQQRLICRGKVLKDDQLLSAYHVEDGHTLHLVVRQPNQPPLGSFPEHTAKGPASGTRQSMGNHGSSVMVGTFNISEQGDGSLPDFSRILSAVLGSLGMSNAGSGGDDAVDLQQHFSERLSRIPGLNEMRNPTGQQSGDIIG